MPRSQQGQQCGECLGQIPAGHDGINMTMRELPFRRLIVFGGFLHGRLCDDARAGEPVESRAEGSGTAGNRGGAGQIHAVSIGWGEGVLRSHPRYRIEPRRGYAI